MCPRPWTCIFEGTDFTGKGVSNIDALKLAKQARDALAAKKGEDIVILDVRGLSSVTDYYVICSGHNKPHIRALSQELAHALRADGVRDYRHAGSPESEWIVGDYFDVVVHIFSGETRRYYDLERLWADARRVE